MSCSTDLNSQSFSPGLPFRRWGVDGIHPCSQFKHNGPILYLLVSWSTNHEKVLLNVLELLQISPEHTNSKYGKDIICELPLYKVELWI